MLSPEQFHSEHNPYHPDNHEASGLEKIRKRAKDLAALTLFAGLIQSCELGEKSPEELAEAVLPSKHVFVHLDRGTSQIQATIPLEGENENAWIDFTRRQLIVANQFLKNGFRPNLPDLPGKTIIANINHYTQDGIPIKSDYPGDNQVVGERYATSGGLNLPHELEKATQNGQLYFEVTQIVDRITGDVTSEAVHGVHLPKVAEALNSSLNSSPYFSDQVLETLIANGSGIAFEDTIEVDPNNPASFQKLLTHAIADYTKKVESTGFSSPQFKNKKALFGRGILTSIKEIKNPKYEQKLKKYAVGGVFGKRNHKRNR